MDNKIQNKRIADLVGGSSQIGKVTPKPNSSAEGVSAKENFESLLQDQLKVSGHAATRMESRNITLTKSEWDRVLDGVQRAAEKGAKESLVLVDDVALVVSVKNKTVITAVDRANLKENVFTNIDSAVIV